MGKDMRDWIARLAKYAIARAGIYVPIMPAGRM
jgi:hypothetical protein